MHKAASSFAAFAAILVALTAAPTHAASATFVSPGGNDESTCPTPVAPCETLFGAFQKTDTGGVMHVLPGEYSSLAIDRAVEIIADGGQASITSSANGGVNTSGRFFVNAGATDDVRIRGFTLRGGTSGVVGPIAGISFVAAGALYVENCTLVDSSGNYGILFVPSGASELYVSNSIMSGNAPAGGGILIRPSGSASAKVVLDNVRVENNNLGINIEGTSTSGAISATIRNSTTSGNTGFGLKVIESGSGASNVTVESSTSSNNGTNGVIAVGSAATIRVRNSTVTGNAGGLVVSGGGQIISHGGNVTAGNTTNGMFTNSVPQQ